MICAMEEYSYRQDCILNQTERRLNYMRIKKESMKILKEKRRFPRIDVELPIFIDTICGFTDGKTLNISAGGAFIRCSNSLTIPERFYLAITNLPQVYLHLPVKAELIWSNGYEGEGNSVYREIGVEFTEISDADRQFISALVCGYTEP